MPATQLWVFFLLVLGVMLLPGLDMACVLGNTLAGGRRRGLAALAGVVAGGAVHVALATVGVGVVLAVIPALFNAMLLAGAAYVAWIGTSLLRSASPAPVAEAAGVPAQPPVRAATSPAGAFRQGLATCLLNPKAYLFMLAVFPQFLRPGAGTLWWQVVVLWLVIAANQVAVYGTLAVAADRARAWLAARPAAGLLAARAVGALLLAVAAYTALEGWQRA